MNITAKAKFETTMGDIVMGFYGDEMPITTENFVKYIEAGFFNKLIFHRVIPGFVIQGGGMMPGMIEKNSLFDPIKLEISKDIKHDPYAISMARTQDKNSATSQFFICNAACPSLDNQYAAFGKVLEGEDVVDAITAVKTKTVKYFDDVPVDTVKIEKAYMIEAE